MRSAFAKLLEKDPVQNSTIEFRAGGNNVPILTRASGQSTAGYQTMGLPTGSKPMPGGGANRTTLGIYRMGESDGNGAPSAIIGNPGDLFPPFGAPGRTYAERTFANVGNNTFQPDDTGSATHALLKRLGDQQFKATSQAPFEDYRAQQRLARDLDEASRNASLSDLGKTREIIRNLAAERRQQNEDDYLRKMLDSGATPEAARKEIEDVRNANAIQEARKVDDRDYQAKSLIQRIAAARGVTSMVQEPLNQSSSIDNPQRSQAMSEAMGKPGDGFGTSPLDMNRQFLTPDFYRKYLRRSTVSQEAGDEQTAFNNMLSSGEIPVPSSGTYSFATLQGQERQQRVEQAAESLAARLETIRARGSRLLLPLPANIVGSRVLDELYRSKGKKKGAKVIYTLESIEELRGPQLLIALNLLTVLNGVKASQSILGQYTFGSESNPSPNLLDDLRAAVLQMNKGEPNIKIPYAATVFTLPRNELVNVLDDFKTDKSEALRKEGKSAQDDLRELFDLSEFESSTGPTISLKRKSNQPLIDQVFSPADAGPSAAGGAGGPAIKVGELASEYESMTVKQLKDELKKQGKPVTFGTKVEAIARLLA